MCRCVHTGSQVFLQQVKPWQHRKEGGKNGRRELFVFDDFIFSGGKQAGAVRF